MARSLLLGLAVLAAAFAGCTDPDEDDGMMMGPGSYHMSMSGMPTMPMSPGQKFNVTVMAQAGMAGMHGTSDHIGAHMWNRSVGDPTGMLGNATSCAHTGGELPGEYRAQCTAPMQPGTYYMRAHARMMDGDGQMHHWWGDERSFTVTSS